MAAHPQIKGKTHGGGFDVPWRDAEKAGAVRFGARVINDPLWGVTMKTTSDADFEDWGAINEYISPRQKQKHHKPSTLTQALSNLKNPMLGQPVDLRGHDGSNLESKFGLKEANKVATNPDISIVDNMYDTDRGAPLLNRRQNHSYEDREIRQKVYTSHEAYMNRERGFNPEPEYASVSDSEELDETPHEKHDRIAWLEAEKEVQDRDIREIVVKLLDRERRTYQIFKDFNLEGPTSYYGPGGALPRKLVENGLLRIINLTPNNKDYRAKFKVCVEAEVRRLIDFIVTPEGLVLFTDFVTLFKSASPADSTKWIRRDLCDPQFHQRGKRDCAPIYPYDYGMN